MIFIRGKLEDVVQVGDKTRLDFARTYAIDGSEIVKVEIQPEVTGEFYDVTDDLYLDWVYDTDADKQVVCRVTDGSLVEETKNLIISVLDEETDNLFSTDTDIVPLEPELLKWVQDGRDSFLDKHRASQREILEELNNAGYSKSDGTRYEAVDIVDIKEFKELSKYTTLRIIFEGISNDIDDVFHEKAVRANTKAVDTKKRAYLRLDVNGDGETTKECVFSGYLKRS
tara:strand:+ start:159 stop:839 length:681 start_codon:yes stop_codon:yes gene_type:complete